MMNKPPSLNRDYHWDPNSKAFKGGFSNHGSTLLLMLSREPESAVKSGAD